MPRIKVDDHFQELMRNDFKFRMYWYARKAVHNSFYGTAMVFAAIFLFSLFYLSKMFAWTRFAFHDFALDISDVIETLSWDDVR